MTDGTQSPLIGGRKTGLGLGLRQSQPVPSALQKHWKYLRCHPLNVGFVPGGTRRIVKAGSATAKIDVRISSDTEVQGINAVLAGLAAHSTPARLEVGGERNRPAKAKPTRWPYGYIGCIGERRKMGALLGLKSNGAARSSGHDL